MLKTFVVLSIVSCGLSIVSCTWSFLVTLRLNALRDVIRRVSSMEESVVRSVMEEGGESSAEAVLRTAERIVSLGRHGMDPETAYNHALRLHKRKV